MATAAPWAGLQGSAPASTRGLSVASYNIGACTDDMFSSEEKKPAFIKKLRQDLGELCPWSSRVARLWPHGAVDGNSAPAATRGAAVLKGGGKGGFQEIHQVDVIGRRGARNFLEASLRTWEAKPHPRGHFSQSLLDGESFPGLAVPQSKLQNKLENKLQNKLQNRLQSTLLNKLQNTEYVSQ